MQSQDIIIAIRKHFEQLAKSNKLVKGIKINPYKPYYLSITWYEDTTILNHLDITIGKIVYFRRHYTSENFGDLRELIGSEKIEYDWTDPQLIENLEALTHARPISSKEKQ